jgi:hypothetical protein
MRRNGRVLVAVCILVCGSIWGCRKANPSPHILEVDAGLIKASVHLWEADEAIRSFISEKGWSYSQEFINSWTFKLITTTPESDTIVFECIQERTEASPVTIYITKNGDSNQRQLTNELKASLEYRFERTRGLKPKLKRHLDPG